MKRISRRNFLKAMGISATALTLAACGGSSSSTAAGTAGSTAASAVATGEPKAGGTLRLCYSSPIATPGYTPRATGNAAIYYLTLSYESLTSYDAEGNMIPNLATEWDVNTDELSITWTLREGVNFADGEPFNAEAVKRNIEEYQANNRTETANIASCEVIDDTHIKMMMAEPNSSTLESVGFFVYYMSPKALENPSSLDAATCGTGPFQLSEFENNAYAIYTKNENYWKEGLPYLDSVEVTLVTESSTANTAFQANEYDMYWVGLANPTILQQLDGAGIYVKEDNQNGMGVESLGLIPNSYGFDRPVIVQYLSWIGGLFRGTMGQSISYQSEIADIILPRLGTTLTMVIPAFIIGTITGILFGIIAAKNRGKTIDSVISFFANIGVSMPMFWLGMMGMLVFALKLRVLPSSGYVPITRDFGGWLSHMIMPIIVLSLGVNAGFVRLTRSSMLEVMRQDYVTTARAKGVSKKDVTFRHQLRNSMIPIVTTMGMRLGSMVGSTVLIESLFVIPGLGSVMMNGISNRDFMLVANGVLIISIFVAICNLVVDILYGIIDPRTR